MQKESTECTRKELEKLTALLKANPEVLHRERREVQEEDDEEETESHHGRTCAAESRNYYLTLELNNALNENATLRNQLDVYKQKDDILSVIGAVLHLNTEIAAEITAVRTPSALSIKEITTEIFNLKTFHEKKTKKIGTHMEQLTGFHRDEKSGPIVAHYINALEKISKKLEVYVERNVHRLEAQITSKHRFENVRWLCICCIIVWLAYFFHNSISLNAPL